MVRVEKLFLEKLFYSQILSLLDSIVLVESLLFRNKINFFLHLIWNVDYLNLFFNDYDIICRNLKKIELYLYYYYFSLFISLK